MICPNCGQPLPDTAKMCYSCKTKFEQQKAAANEQHQPSSLGITVLRVLGFIVCVGLIILGIYLASSMNHNPFDFGSP